jgi:hypothetical protein
MAAVEITPQTIETKFSIDRMAILPSYLDNTKMQNRSYRS